MNHRRNFILLLCLVFSACAPATKPVPVALTPFREKTPTVTLPATQPPAKTPLATDTYEPYPTSTYMAPTPIASAHYRLKLWTADLANDWIKTLRKYPDSLGYSDRGYHDSGYYYAYIYAALAEQESQLLFPSSSYQEEWTWDRSYNLSQSAGDDALKSYLSLVTDGLTTGATNVSGLESWFKKHETRLDLKVTQLPGTPENYLLEIAGGFESYGGFLWVTKTQGEFTVYPLPGNDDDYYGNFHPASADRVAAQLMDITGDGIAEIITVHEHGHGVGRDFNTTGFDVFDVSHGVPERLRFVPDVSYTRGDDWSLLEENHQAIGLVFNFYEQGCQTFSPQEYRWNGKNFDRWATLYPSRQQLMDNQCFNFFVSSLPDYFRNNKRDALKKWNELIVDWPDPKESRLREYENLPDARDKLRFKAGLYLAFDGDVAGARREISAIVQSPVISNSHWIALAKTFLANFNAPGDLPQTCLAIKLCAQFFDVEMVIKLAGVTHQDPINFLRQVGIILGVGGSIDVNHDGQMDQWVNITDSVYHNTLPWVFVATKDGSQPLAVGYYSDEGIKSLKSKPDFQGSPLFVVDGINGAIAYALKTDPETSQMTTFRLCDSISSDLINLQSDLFNDHSLAAVIEKKLLIILPELERDCQDEDYLMAFARYLLGVAYQLSGDAIHAAENYYLVWQLYPQSPFSLMAYFKLEVSP